jgi:hypothetical protein
VATFATDGFEKRQGPSNWPDDDAPAGTRQSQGDLPTESTVAPVTKATFPSSSLVVTKPFLTTSVHLRARSVWSRRAIERLDIVPETLPRKAARQ